MKKLKPNTEGDRFLYVHPSIFDRIKNTGYGIVRIGCQQDTPSNPIKGKMYSSENSSNGLLYYGVQRTKRHSTLIINATSHDEQMNCEISGIICRCCQGFPIRNIYKL